ncbi:hypothetical protein SO802_032607 [Lithocarpus litseifolius]|uniref:RNase H type-1 domain-containing protein n=1 Tax=Lithocarpus litseifolius TaxID=425828 RepID=A0AAW2BB99_9ROSI
MQIHADSSILGNGVRSSSTAHEFATTDLPRSRLDLDGETAAGEIEMHRRLLKRDSTSAANALIKAIIDVLANPRQSNSVISSIVDDCRQLASQIPRVQFFHCFMEVNRCVDALAKVLP